MPEKQSTTVVKHGDVTQRVGVEVIRARGVDVEKLTELSQLSTSERVKCFGISRG